MEVFTGGPPTPREKVRDEWLPRWIQEQTGQPGYGAWAAVERSSGAFVGLFMLRPRRDGDPDAPELGYRLRKAAWGRGFASEGAKALIDHAFGEIGAQRVWAETLAVHTASRRVLEEAGLRFVRSFHQPWPYPVPGDEYGDVEYALSREEWQRERPSDVPAGQD